MTRISRKARITLFSTTMLTAICLFSLPSTTAQITTLTLEAPVQSAEEQLQSWIFKNSKSSSTLTPLPPAPTQVGWIPLESMDSETATSPEECGTTNCTCEYCEEENELEWTDELCCPSNTDGDSDTKDAFVQKMTVLLSAALKDKDLDSVEAKTAISNCLEMVAQQSKTEAQTMIAKKELAFEKEMAQMRGHVLQCTVQASTINDLKNWLGPLYTNQNRTLKQMELLSFSSNSLNKTLGLLEKQMSHRQARESKPIKYTNPHVRRDSAEPDVYDLRRQVSALKQQIERLQSQDVQPAQHLQPIFDSKQLEPIDIPWPSEGSWGQQQYRR